MDKNRLWMIGSGLVMVVVVALGWLLGFQPQIASISAADSQRSVVETTNSNHADVLAKLKADFKGIHKLKLKLATLDASVPTGTKIPDFVNQLNALASAKQVTFAGLTVADAQPYTPVVAPVAAVAPAAAAGSSPSPTPTTSPSATPAPAPVSKAGVPPVTSARITAGNFAALAVQITVKGPMANALNFVDGLQTGKRLFLVSGLTTKPSEDVSGAVDAVISGYIYVLVPAPKASATATVAQ